MASSPSFAATPRVGSTMVSTADAGLAEPTNGGSATNNVLTAGSSGSRINAVIVQALGTTSVGLVRLWIYDAAALSSSAAYSLIREIPIAAVVPSASTPAFQVTVTFDHLSIPAGFSLRAATSVAQSLRVTAMAADY